MDYQSAINFLLTSRTCFNLLLGIIFIYVAIYIYRKRLRYGHNSIDWVLFVAAIVFGLDKLTLILFTFLPLLGLAIRPNPLVFGLLFILAIHIQVFTLWVIVLFRKTLSQ